MKHSACIAAAAVALVTSHVAAQGFEGAVSMMVTGETGRSMPINYQLKGGKIRYELNGPMGNAAVIVDPATRKQLFVVDAQKMVMEMSLDAAAPGMAAQMEGARGRGRGEPASVKRTGRMQKIAGFDCEDVEVTDADGSTLTACVTQSINAGFVMPMAGVPMPGRGGGGARASGWSNGISGFPLKISKGGRDMLVVTSIETKAIPDAVFTPPADYQRMDMSAMMRRP